MYGKFKEACGVIGIYGNKEDEALGRSIYYGLYALQHRGQESAGIAVTSGSGIKYHKAMGLVSEAFNDEILDNLSGYIGVGHVRYCTNEANTLINAQPLVVRYKNGYLAVAHNGNLINAPELRKELEEQGVAFQTEIDSEVIAFLIARQHSEDISKAVEKCMDKLKGSYALVIMTEDTLIGMRDPYGIRPLCLGKQKDSYVLASESCALDTIDAQFIRDIEPGEIVVINKDGIRSIKKSQAGLSYASCIFEFVYFARPDSTIDGRSVYMARLQAGRLLAEEQPVDADLVIGVPDSGTVSALGYAAAAGIPFDIGLIKNRYVGRTFIKPTRSSRAIGVKLKLNAVREVVKGKRLVMVDDSIVRGTTSGLIVNLLREAGAKEVHVRVSSPPVVHSCYFGIDTSTRKELIGAQRNIEEIREHIGADSLGYLSLHGLIKATGLPAEKFCSGCFTGKYPLDVPRERKRYVFEKR
ncbi:amidophosphoribosyltransferase [Tepidanaerobacter sp. GT38]|uniref:amidophosphoribosyltransferase n=1 Tax=Tepidanaerobacter sp. GT38 TaxID=2722793 RepID=UPI001F028E4D|nr:amidophosphoribosyltransferase [Tepidanaerobacter sp. GT38]MCG1012816.1 amidophosphoribosyltransferase [Tepidanaerobacter sp. GT38]